LINYFKNQGVSIRMTTKKKGAAAPEATTADEQVVLSLTDIQNAVKVIDFAAEQGAFKGWQTIEQVLTVRNRLNTFLSAAEDAQKNQSAEGAAAAATAVKS
jgi:hypothetical protein